MSPSTYSRDEEIYLKANLTYQAEKLVPASLGERAAEGDAACGLWQYPWGPERWYVKTLQDRVREVGGGTKAAGRVLGAQRRRKIDVDRARRRRLVKVEAKG